MSETPEAEIDVDELQILLNLMGERVVIKYPLYSNIQILTANPTDKGYKLKIHAKRDQFAEGQNAFGEWSLEMPSYNDLTSCLLSSGVISYENIKEFEKYRQRYATFTKKVFFSPDTNILYHRFLSTFGGITAQEIAIVNIVKGEIKASINHKYSPSQILKLKKYAKYQKALFNELGNKRMMKARKAKYLALREYKDLGNVRSVSSTEKRTKDAEANDQIIVRSLKRFEEESSALVVLLTADNLMADLCEIEEIEHFFFKYPHAKKATFCSFPKMLELVFCLAVVFGVIQLGPVLIFGEFGGKADPDIVKLRFINKDIFPTFKKHLNICRQLSNLKIEK